MAVITRKIKWISEGSFFSSNITEKIRAIVQDSAIQEGITVIFYQHTTGALVLAEHEAGILVDLENVMEKLIPVEYDYKHHLRGYDTNGAAHLRAVFANSSITVPITEGDLDLGTYQEILVIDFDEQVKQRSIIVKIIGE